MKKSKKDSCGYDSQGIDNEKRIERHELIIPK